MKFIKIIQKLFSKNSVYFNPSLKNKVKTKQTNTGYIGNLLASEKLSESKSEINNNEEKINYESLIKEASNQMYLNFYKIYDDTVEKENKLKTN